MKYAEQKGLISIIIPIYNNEVYLRECLDSVLAQTHTNWEAILVNDGSTDNTGKIIDEYAKKDSRFTAIHKQNEGTLLARKTGLENSKGEFIANIDHDDKYHPLFLEKMYARITETNSDFVWCKYQLMNNEGVPRYTADYKWNTDVCKNMAMILLTDMAMATWNKLIKREIYAKIRFPNVHLTWGEDSVQTLQVAYHSKLVTYIPEYLYFYRIGVGATSCSNPIPAVVSIITDKKILEELFNGIIPLNMEKAFYCACADIAFHYFRLDKKTRAQFKDEIEPMLPKITKYARKLNLKICLFLASKKIVFPFVLRETLKKYYINLKKHMNDRGKLS